MLSDDGNEYILPINISIIFLYILQYVCIRITTYLVDGSRIQMVSVNFTISTVPTSYLDEPILLSLECSTSILTLLVRLLFLIVVTLFVAASMHCKFLVCIAQPP